MHGCERRGRVIEADVELALRRMVLQHLRQLIRICDQFIQYGLRYLRESVVRWRKHRERAGALQCLRESGRLQGCDQCRKILVATCDVEDRAVRLNDFIVRRGAIVVLCRKR